MNQPDAVAQLLAAAERHVLAGESVAGIAVAQQAMALAQVSGDNNAVAHAAMRLGALYRMGSQHARAADALTLAQAQFEAIGNDLGLSEVAMQRGQMALDTGDYVHAIDALAEGATFASRANATLLQSRCLTGLGIASARVGNYDRARRNYAQALTLQNELGDDGAAANTLHCQGVLELRVAHGLSTDESARRERLVLEAVKLLEASKVLAEKTGRRRLEGMCLNELGRAHRLLSDTSAVIAYCGRAIDIFNQLPAPKDECEALLHIAGAWLDADNTASASQFAHRSLSLAMQYGYLPSERDARNLLVECYERTGDIPSAFAHLKAVRRIDREIQDGEALRRIDQLDHSSAIARSGEIQRQLQERADGLRELAQTDALTGLVNRRGFELTVERAVASGARTLSIILADIDHFKRINDVYGHLVGDEALRGVASALRGACRSADHLARWGGEEFVVLLIDASTDEATVIAERLRSAVAHIDWPSASQALQLTLSAGIATGPATAPLATLLQAADGALYAAKQSGRDRICVAPDCVLGR